MKIFTKLFFFLIYSIYFLKPGIAQDSIFVFPTYTLTATNFQYTQPNWLEFDIYIRQTNGNVTPFIYGSAQYYWDFNPGIAFPGDTLKFSMVSSDLPVQYRPVNPYIAGNMLRMAPNLPTNPDDSPRISSQSPGTLIAKMRLRTTGATFTGQNPNIQWRSVLPNPITKIAAFTGENNFLLYEIQTPATHFVDSIILPTDIQVISTGDNGVQVYPSNIINPSGIVKNNSQSSATFTVTRKINPGGYINTQTITNLAANTSSIVTFAPWTFISGTTYTIKDSVYLMGDSFHDNDTLTGSITPYSGILIVKLDEGFTGGTFPPTNWTITYSGISYWYRSPVSGFGSGTGSSKYDIWNSPLGTTQSLNSLTLSPSVLGDSLKFDLAYAPFPGSTDSLIIMISSNGGNNYSDFVRLYGNTNGGATLNTTGSATSEFTPSSNQWGKRSYLLPVGTTNIRFRGVNGYGNNIYIDNIQIAGIVPSTLVNLKIVPEGLHNRFTLNRKDKITAYLRETTPPFNIKDSAKADLDTVSFIARMVFQNFTTGNYYIQVKHKNSIETWSRSGGELITVGSEFNYDFTTSQSQAYGNNLILKNNLYCLYSGDVNQDGVINLSDIISVYNDAVNFQTGNVVTDLNGDNIVNLSDQIIGFNNLVNFVSVIRP